MKLEIDTIAKTIKFEESVNIQDLYTQLLLLFPMGEWKEYRIIPNYVTVKEWNTIPWVTPWWSPTYPTYPNTGDPVWKLPSVICGTDPVNTSDNKITVTYSNK